MIVIKRIFIFCLLAGCSVGLAAQVPAGGAGMRAGMADRLAIRWTCVKNIYEMPNRSVSRLTLMNKGNGAFPLSGWGIYFNSNRSIDPHSVIGGQIEHINGDLYCLRLQASDGVRRGLKPGGTLPITFTSSDLSINISDAPIGFYLVWDDRPAQGHTIHDYQVDRIDDPMLGALTPGMEYQRNMGFRQMDTAKVSRVYPTPLWYRDSGSAFLLDGKTPVVADAGFEGEAAYLSTALAGVIGRRPVVKGGASGKAIILRHVDEAEGQGWADSSAYRMEITDKHILISASAPVGIFYGIQSFLSALPAGVWRGAQSSVMIPGLVVADRPRFAVRALMLDVARNFRSEEEVRRVLDLMALCKLNVLHLHLCDDEGWRLEIPSLPELTEVGAYRGLETGGRVCLPPSFGSGPLAGMGAGSGYYSKASFISLLRYARERHIEVVPEIECPGHARAAIKAMDARYKKYARQGNMEEARRYLLRDTMDRSVYESAQMWRDNVIAVALPSVYRWFDKVIGEVCAMYKEAGAPLRTIHLGGDELPAGVWEQSPACRALMEQDRSLASPGDARWYFYNRLDSLVKRRGLVMSGWEEVALRKVTEGGKTKVVPDSAWKERDSRVHVWNNMIGGGDEDLPYRLANAGYKVILSCVSNNYYDMASNKSFDERGYHWGGFLDVDKPYAFMPYDYYRNAREDYTGGPVAAGYFRDKELLTEEGKKNILGIEGLLWAENLPTDERMEYMLLPKLLGTAERAWAPDPMWAMETDSAVTARLYAAAWNGFMNVVGQRLLPRLSYMNGGYAYRIPVPGVSIEGGLVRANLPMPGFMVRYTTDGSVPGASSRQYDGPVAERKLIRLRTFDVRGRGGRTVDADNRVSADDTAK
ncbi:MAG: carbohydate-binding domain-containing protein [Sphingobacteriales bacterium]|nr:carbohydate-binding domain-containing protein [Sphingobacteriales bacterium]